MREGLAVGIGAALGMATAGGAYAALTSDDAGAKRVGGIVAGASVVTAAGVGALLLRTGHRPDALIGALGFVGLPSLLMTGVIQNRRDA